MTMRPHLKEACEQIDAAVFSGDALHDKAARQELRAYLARWDRGLDEIALGERPHPLAKSALVAEAAKEQGIPVVEVPLVPRPTVEELGGFPAPSQPDSQLEAFTHWLDDRRDQPVSEVFHDVVGHFLSVRQAYRDNPTPQVAPMSQPNRLVAYSGAAKLRELGYEWDGTSWAPPAPTPPLSDEAIRMAMVLTPLYGDDKDYAHWIRMGRAVLAAAERAAKS